MIMNKADVNKQNIRMWEESNGIEFGSRKSISRPAIQDVKRKNKESLTCVASNVPQSTAACNPDYVIADRILPCQ